MVRRSQRRRRVGHKLTVDDRQRVGELRIERGGAGKNAAALGHIHRQRIGAVRIGGGERRQRRREHALPRRRNDGADLEIG